MIGRSSTAPGSSQPGAADGRVTPAPSENALPKVIASNGVRRDVVVVGGSAGSLRPLTILLGQLPAELPAALFVVIHGAANPWNSSALVEALQPGTQLPVTLASNLQPVVQGRVYICPANHHLSLENGLMRLDKAPREHYTRPSINVLFRSSAREYGRRVVGVLLSGSLQDGVAGLWQIKHHGGIALVQDPAEAESVGMPKSAIGAMEVDSVQPVLKLAEELICLLTKFAGQGEARSRTVLIVEDEALVAGNLREHLLEQGYEVSGVVGSGEDAVRVAAERNPDVVLMDIRLEGNMSGVEAARTIWESLQIPIIFVTANADPATLNEVKTVPNYGFLVKPFHSANIQAIVELALDRREKEGRHASGTGVVSA